MTRRLFISAGELSGEQHAARLVTELRQRDPELAVDCMGGRHLEAAGARLVFPLTDFDVLGITEVLKKSREFFGILQTFVDYLLRERPLAVVLVDYPGLHLGFAKLAHRHGFPVIYYICPQLWAWAPWRNRWFGHDVDHALTILPFEAEYFRRRGVDTHYVGHPAADQLAEQEVLERNTPLEREVRDANPGIVLMPGSRTQEVRTILPLMIAVARNIRRRFPDVQFFIPQARDVAYAACEEVLREAQFAGVRLERSVIPLLRGAHFALVASGTATFEVAYFGVPMVVLYMFPRFQRFMGSQLITVPWISQANLIAGRPLVPEFVKSGGPLDEVTDACLGLIGDTEARRDCVTALNTTLRPYFAPGATERAAARILGLLDRFPAPA